MDEIRLITLDPGHFHAALVQKEMYPDVSRRVHVYAPLGPDLTAHMNRIAAFNARLENPTAWELEAHCAPDFLGRMVKERNGNVVILAGQNHRKMEYIRTAIEAGFHVLADKPWIISPHGLAELEAALEAADRAGLAAYDIMTERFEITSILQRALVNDEAVFGSILEGGPDDPAVVLESVHHIAKTVAGAPLVRPAWFFDIRRQGEGLADVGPHLVDLVQWTLFPGQAIDHLRDIELLGAARWPTTLTEDEFRRVTGEARFPEFLETPGARFDYFCNNSVSYRLRGVHVAVKAAWNYQAPEGTGDTHLARYRGAKSRVEVRQGREENYRPELYVVPEGARAAEVLAALRERVASLARDFPGVTVGDLGKEMRVAIPDAHRTGHEAHFAQVAKVFFEYARSPRSVPAWEKPNMLAKYSITTKGVALSHAA